MSKPIPLIIAFAISTNGTIENAAANTMNHCSKVNTVTLNTVVKPGTTRTDHNIKADTTIAILNILFLNAPTVANYL